MSTTSPSASASATPKQEESTGGSNIGVIVGSVCGFVAIIGAGFAYAFFSKTRRNNRRNKRLYSDNGDLYDHHNSYQTDQYNNTRPSPAMAASAIAAADDIHKHNNNNNGQWEMAEQQPYGYNNTMMSPQPPMATVAKQHDPYYNSPQMGYAAAPNMTSSNYYNGQAYYDPNAGYQQQQQQHYDQHYDQHYAEPQYDPYSVQQQQQHQSPVMNANMAPLPTLSHQNATSASSTVVGSAAPPPIATTNSNVYQTPHSYPEDNQKTSVPTNANNEGSYR